MNILNVAPHYGSPQGHLLSATRLVDQLHLQAEAWVSAGQTETTVRLLRFGSLLPFYTVLQNVHLFWKAFDHLYSPFKGKNKAKTWNAK